MKTNSLALVAARRLSRVVVLSMLLLSVSWPAQARVGAPPLSSQRSVLPLSAVQQLVLPPTDVVAEKAIDAQRPPEPLRFAVARPVRVSTVTHGTWEQLPEGRLWRLRLLSDGATDLNLGFTTCWLPDGATLHILSETNDYYQGPYTVLDNKPHGELWTPVVPGAAAVVELFVPAGAQAEPTLVLKQVGAGYRDMFKLQKDLNQPKAGSCNIDVVCPEAAPWANEIRSVARYSIAGVGLCTGTLIGNAQGDFRNFFLTANHCDLTVANSPSVVVYWNYQSPTCGQHGGGSLAQNQTGATFRAAKYDVDFALIELDQTPDPAFRVYYSGWDRSGTAPTGAVGIHHPNGDEKSISFSSNPVTSTDSCIGTGGIGTHWSVTWTSGVTEPGSSGSGLWDSTTHRVVGTLSGGGSSCTTPFAADCYGKFSVAWGSGASAAERLRDWLDPQNTGVMSVAGADPVAGPVVHAAGAVLAQETCFPTNGVIDPGETVTVLFSLQNVGTAPTTNLVATLLVTNGVTSPSGAQAYGVLASGGSAVTHAFTFTASGTCGGSIAPMLSLVDGTNQLGTVSFSFVLGVPSPALSESFDGVTVPDLPAGWTASVPGGWYTVATRSDSAPNSAFSPNTDFVSDYQMLSPTIAIPSPNAQLTFRHYYDTEEGFDGGVLEIAIDGGAFADIITAGGSFVTGGYNLTIDPTYGNPLGARPAWSGLSGGFITTRVNLPAGTAGHNVQFRWRMASDESYKYDGWYVDTVSVSGTYTCCDSGTGGNLPPVVCPQPVFVARVGASLFVTNCASDPDVPAQQILFSLGASTATGARINSTNGVFRWRPTVDKASTTNLFEIIATDNGTPSLSATQLLSVIVNDYLSLTLGRTVLATNQSGSVPLTVYSSAAVTGITARLSFPAAYLANFSISPLSGSASASMVAPGVYDLLLAASPGTPFKGQVSVASLSFQVLPNPSAFVPLTVTNITAHTDLGALVPQVVVGDGRVVAVGYEPLLEGWLPSGTTRGLALYGGIGGTFTVQGAGTPVNGSWSPYAQLTMTNLVQTLPMDAAPSLIFFRAYRQ